MFALDLKHAFVDLYHLRLRRARTRGEPKIRIAERNPGDRQYRENQEDPAGEPGRVAALEHAISNSKVRDIMEYISYSAFFAKKGDASEAGKGVPLRARALESVQLRTK